MRATSLTALLFFALGFVSPSPGEETEAEIIVYGATPAGIAAALAAGKLMSEVLLIEPTNRIGGLVTNGLSHSDFRTFEGITGTFLEFTKRVEKHYIDAFGADSPQAKGNFRGTHGEPKINLQIFTEMLGEVPTIRIIHRQRLRSIRFHPDEKRIASIECSDPDGKTTTFRGDVFIDATYEGDLMAAAGVDWTAGREGRGQYGESLAPKNADNQLQAYNFRFIMTKEPDLRVLPKAPDGYDRHDFLAVVPLLEQGKFKSVVCNSTGGIIKAHLPSLPNGKHDMNDVSRGLVRLSLAGLNAKWPGGTPADRQKIFGAHLRHNIGLLYFLQNDKTVPARYRDEARQWGWCRDEFTATGHIPEQLYIREARRMIGARVFTEKDTGYAPGDARSVFQPDSIAIGDYGNNCHGTAHEGPRIGGKHTGEFYKKVAPYQIPLGTIVPKDIKNLLVPVACSASHVGFCALRLEPIWTSLGQAAGVMANIIPDSYDSVQEITAAEVRNFLHRAGAPTLYISDVLPGHPEFEAVQRWGSLGGFHGLAPTPEEPGQRGEHLLGQYFKAYPDHAADLDRPLDAHLWKQWAKIAKSADLSVPDFQKNMTRGDFIRNIESTGS